MSLYRGKYRIESARLKGFDYASPGSYYVTINTWEGVCWFGKVVGGRMHLTEIGRIVIEEWFKTAEIRPTVTLDAFQVMPNHLHGIVMIHSSVSDARSGHIPFVNWDKSMVVPGGKPAETSPRDVSTRDKPKLKPNSLGSILGQFKSKCTTRIHDAGCATFQWQERFWDHIIRDGDDLARIRRYIANNPGNWAK